MTSFRPMVESLEDRVTPCSLPAPIQPGEPPPAIVCDECDACQPTCIGIILDDADVAAATALDLSCEAEAHLEAETEYEVDLVYEPVATNPFVAQYRNLTDAQLQEKATDCRNRANTYVADANAIKNRDYSGLTGAGWAIIDSAYLPYLYMKIHEVRLQIEALIQVHGER